MNNELTAEGGEGEEWQPQEVGVEATEMCSGICMPLRTRMISRPGGLRRQVGGCGLAGRSYERRGIGWKGAECELVYDLMEFMVVCCAERKNKERPWR